jgi:hypothetical protein
MASDQLGPLFSLLRYQLFKGWIVDEFVFTAHANQKGMNFGDKKKDHLNVVGYTFFL